MEWSGQQSLYVAHLLLHWHGCERSKLPQPYTLHVAVPGAGGGGGAGGLPLVTVKECSTWQPSAADGVCKQKQQRARKIALAVQARTLAHTVRPRHCVLHGGAC